jgi:hypothetical protein
VSVLRDRQGPGRREGAEEGGELAEGAWSSAALIGAMTALFCGVRRHYRTIEDATGTQEPLRLEPTPPPIVVVPLRGWDRVARTGLRFAYTLTEDVVACQVLNGDSDARDLSDAWPRLVEEPVARAGRRPPRLLTIRSRYRRLFRPLLSFVTKLSSANPERQVAVLVPEMVEPRWYHYLLHRNTAAVLRWLVRRRGRTGIVIISTPWYLGDRAERGG